ncbi:hypothetical protein EDD22DRAFT_981361 [Suillus occidentalis]|nr:hypothetical protein EDD22DRAFT_981361 [Suillus occidentalis]
MSFRGTSSKKVPGLSRAAIKHRYHGSTRLSGVLTAGKQSQRKEEAIMKRQMQLQEMSTEDRNAVAMMISDNGIDFHTDFPAPPGEEGIDLSHEGGEHEEFAGCSPLYPSVVISLRTLAAYCQSHRTCPRFSIQAQCKTLCHLHDFSAAYDIYLEILYRVKCRLDKALGRNTPNWRLQNACPCCFYKLEGERPLVFDWLATVDGNNSLKRWASSTYGTDTQKDSWQAHSDYWVDQIAVDKFQNDARAPIHATTQGSEFNCTDRWRNAGPEQHKKCLHLKTPPPKELLQIHYVEVLDELAERQ